MTLAKSKKDKLYALLRSSTRSTVRFDSLSRQGKLIVSQLLLGWGDRKLLPSDLQIFEQLVGVQQTQETVRFLSKHIVKLSEIFGLTKCIAYKFSTRKLIDYLVKESVVDQLQLGDDCGDLATNIIRKERPGSIVLVLAGGGVFVHGVSRLRQIASARIKSVVCLVYDVDDASSSNKSVGVSAFKSIEDMMAVVGLKSEILNPAFRSTESNMLDLLCKHGEHAVAVKALLSNRNCQVVTFADAVSRRSRSSSTCRLNFTCPRCYVARYVIPLERFRRETDGQLFWHDRRCDQTKQGVEFQMIDEAANSLFESDLWSKAVHPIMGVVLPVYKPKRIPVVRSFLIVNKKEHRIFRNSMLKNWRAADGPTDYSAYQNYLMSGMWSPDGVSWARHKSFAAHMPYVRLIRSRNVKRSS